MAGMEEEYDVIILGTGIKECILSGLLSKTGHKVLHLDRNDYYGAESASLNLKQLYQKCARDKSENKDNDNNNDIEDSKIDEATLGRSKSYSIDLCPKFLMGCGDLVKMLIHTGVTRYLDFQCIGGSYILSKEKANKYKLNEIPITAKAVWNSSLLGYMQKMRYKSFLMWIVNVDINDKKTWKKCDLNNQTMREIYKYWKCDDDNLINFTGHAIALYKNDDYLDDKSLTMDCITRLQLYANSLFRFEKSPYIYPVYGLGGLPEGFSRLAAVYGGVYMLKSNIKKIEYDDGDENESKSNSEFMNVKGVEIENDHFKGFVKCKKLISDPSYFMDTKRVKKTGVVARWLCILDHPVVDTNETSSQIILSTSVTGHKSDIYISVQSAKLNVTPDGKWIAMISSQVYTNEPRKELKIAFDLLGKVLKDFLMVNDMYAPVVDGANAKDDSNVFICSSMDATTHFQQTTQEVMKIYKEITGKDIDLNASPEQLNNDQ